MQQQQVWPKLISAIVPVAGFPNGTSQIDTWTKSNGLSNFEIIFVNDSDDLDVERKLREIALELRETSKVNIIKSECRNPGGSRNLGSSIATGSWIVFWDCDDIPNPHKVLEMILRADGTSSDITLGEFQILNSVSENVTVKKIANRRKILESVAMDPGLWRFAFKSDLVKETKFPELSMAEDQIFLAEILCKSTHLSCFHEPVYEYWNHPSGQLTKNKIKIRQLSLAVDYFYNKYKTRKCQPTLIVIVRLTFTALKNDTLIGKLAVFSKFLKFVVSHPREIKSIIFSAILIWRSK
jgi:glycosyltransferase involved in cell wall biosynthesis